MDYIKAYYNHNDNAMKCAAWGELIYEVKLVLKSAIYVMMLEELYCQNVAFKCLKNKLETICLDYAIGNCKKYCFA